MPERSGTRALVAARTEWHQKAGLAVAERNGADPALRVQRWPVLAPEAHYGLPGDVVETIEPHSEADRAAILVTFLVAYGNMIGRGASFKIGADSHHMKVNVVLVGETSKARKGMSWNYNRDVLKAVDPHYIDDRVVNGLSSGEGLIHAVRDRVMVEDGNGDPVVLDPGVEDKRLLVMESEFANVLKMCQRQGNILSIEIRSAWDDEKLQTLTKGNPTKATDAHVSIVGHITRIELERLLSQSDASNGFANRFLWVLVCRSKELPFGGDWSGVDVASLVTNLRGVVEFGRRAGELAWGESARELWVEEYHGLSEGHPGLFGAVTSRSEAHVLRLAAIYALMDLSRTIELDHLKAGLAVWRYAEESARNIFGDATGDPVADRIEEMLSETPAGMTRAEIRDAFGRNQRSERIGQALQLLERLGRIRKETEHTGGRPAERWFFK